MGKSSINGPFSTAVLNDQRVYGVGITYLKIRAHMISPEFRDCCWSEYSEFKLYDCWPNKDTLISMDRNCNQYYLKVWKCPLTAQKNGICLPFAASRWADPCVITVPSANGRLSPNQDRPMSGRFHRTKWQPKRVDFFCIYLLNIPELILDWRVRWPRPREDATGNQSHSRFSLASELRNPHATILWPTHHKANALRVAATFGCCTMAAMWFYSRSQYIEEILLASKHVHRAQLTSRMVFPKSVALPVSGHQPLHSSQPQTSSHSRPLGKETNGTAGLKFPKPSKQSTSWTMLNQQKKNMKMAYPLVI